LEIYIKQGKREMLYGTTNPHGGDLYGKPVCLDFSVNTNPLGTPPAVIKAVECAAQCLCQYPDPYCRELVRAISAHDGVPAESVLCGSGAAELIYAYCESIKAERALLTAPTFSEYASALAAAGTQVVYYPLRESVDFAVTEEFIGEIKRTDCKVVFLCNPNNPTGQLISPQILEAVCETCCERGIRLFLDECFLELSDVGQGTSMSKYLSVYPNLFILRAFTKSYGMAGLRLGYCLTDDAALLSAMSRRTQPWNVSLPAQAAGIAALREKDFPGKARELIQAERPKLAEKLEKLGIYVCPSQANYLLLKSGAELYGPLLARGILIRDCSNYEGLGPGWYRVAVKTAAENRSLTAALTEVLTK